MPMIEPLMVMLAGCRGISSTTILAEDSTIRYVSAAM